MSEQERIRRLLHPGEAISQTHKVFARWLGDDYDLDALDAVLSAAVSARFDGDPPWMLVVSGSGAAKTESVMPLAAAGALVVSTISGEAALLSGTSEKEKTKRSTGGLLRVIGERGLLVVKDFTSILSMNRDTRAIILAAMREIYDGRWSRNVGTDGGRTLSWHGRLVLIGAVTSAWDSAYAATSAMGDRFVLVRVDSAVKRRAAGLQALRNVNHETDMRRDLADAVAELLDGTDPAAAPDLTEDEMLILLDLADVVTRGRTAVERAYDGTPMFAHALEMPTRFAKQLAQIVRGGISLGMTREHAIDVAVRCAGDSMPPLRLRALADIAGHPLSRTSDATKRLQLPRRTVDRTLQEMHLLGLLVVEEEPYGEKVRWLYMLAPEIDLDAVRSLAARKLARNVSTPMGGDAANASKPTQTQDPLGDWPDGTP